SIAVDGVAGKQVHVDGAGRRGLLQELQPGDDAPGVGAERVARALVAQVHHELLEIGGAQDFALEKIGALLGDVVHGRLLNRSAWRWPSPAPPPVDRSKPADRRRW